MTKFCQTKWQMFWKTVIFGNIFRIWHHLAPLSQSKNSFKVVLKPEPSSVLLGFSPLEKNNLRRNCCGVNFMN